MGRFGKALVGVAAVLVVAGGSYVGYQVYEEESRNERARQREARSQSMGSEFARCVAQMLSPKGMEELVVHQYKPAGVVWRQLADKGYNFPTPSGTELHEFKRQGHAFDWTEMPNLIRKCSIHNHLDYWDDRPRYIFWESLEQEATFQAALSRVKARNDAILKPYREAELAKQAAAEAVAKQKREERDAELYRSPQS